MLALAASARIPVKPSIEFELHAETHGDASNDARIGQITTYTAEAEADRVQSLPGWGAISGFNMFAG